MNYLQKKKLAFMSIVNQIKGFVRSISGVPPITLESCVDDKSVIDYKIYGNSVQDGEPSPDNPVEVVSVGEKTRNLITANDGYIQKINEDRYVKYEAETQIFTIQGSGLMPYVYFPETIPSGTTTSIFAEIINDDYEIINGTLVIGGYGVSPSWQNTISFSATSAKKQSRVFTTTADANRICIYVDANVKVKNVKVRITYAICDTAFTEYEPYGYKIPIKVSGKNIANFSIVSSQYNVKTEKIAPNIFKVTKTNNKAVAYGQIETYVETGKTYTLFRMVESEKSIGNIPVWKSYNAASVYTYWTPTYYTFTATQERFILGLYPNQSANLKGLETTFTFMLVEGSYTASTFPDYEPYHEPITTNIYLDEPLRAIGNYRDYIDFESRKLIRNVAESQMLSKYILSKSSSSSDSTCILLVNSTNPFGKAKTGSYSGKLYNSIGKAYSWNRGAVDGKVSWYNNVSGNKISFFAIPVSYLTNAECENTLAGSKVWIDTQNTIYPIVITYALETPTEETIDLSNLPTFKGTTIYTIGTTIQPSNMDVTYYSTEKE